MCGSWGFSGEAWRERATWSAHPPPGSHPSSLCGTNGQLGRNCRPAAPCDIPEPCKSKDGKEETLEVVMEIHFLELKDDWKTKRAESESLANQECQSQTTRTGGETRSGEENTKPGPGYSSAWHVQGPGSVPSTRGKGSRGDDQMIDQIVTRE